MHTLLLVFSLRFGMADFADRMRRLCWVLERGLPSAPGITVSMVYHKPKKSIFFQGADIRVFVDCLNHLNKTNMAPSDIPIIRAAILDVIAPLGISMEELALERIDYCQNVVVMDPKERRLAMRLWHKTSKHFLKAERMDPKHSENENRLYYKCRDDFYRVQLYNKQTEREDKGLAAESYELGVLRLEYQLRRDHLLYPGRGMERLAALTPGRIGASGPTICSRRNACFSVGTFTPSAGRKPSCGKRACPQRIFRESGNSWRTFPGPAWIAPSGKPGPGILQISTQTR